MDLYSTLRYPNVTQLAYSNQPDSPQNTQGATQDLTINTPITHLSYQNQQLNQNHQFMHPLAHSLMQKQNDQQHGAIYPDGPYMPVLNTQTLCLSHQPLLHSQHQHP
ncbi:hypothetical protein CROQUDRAFT_90722 [Cronartium quercuum f. sp. fusiforme G11]|uniref:Uncharacterized protein n=1 Tax=Cronartium quercuum f. sp. fusiforme G11 TaxID=708437 RepID=A0A9P6TD82_9BASI|nr:hypothetical protein CROQUDRAFT_90722 [Cronartium quercuum f. sp. fusiforme G11]